MTDLEIAIEQQKEIRANLQQAISHRFRYGRTPADREYLSLTRLGIEIEKVEYALDVLEELQEG